MKLEFTSTAHQTTMKQHFGVAPSVKKTTHNIPKLNLQMLQKPETTTRCAQPKTRQPLSPSAYPEQKGYD